MLKWDKKQLKMNNELSARKNFRRYERTSSKVKTACKVWESIEKFKNFQILEKKIFSLIEKKQFCEGSFQI